MWIDFILWYNLIDCFEDMGEFVVFNRFYFYGYYMYFFIGREFGFVGFVVWFLENCYYLGIDYVRIIDIC